MESKSCKLIITIVIGVMLPSTHDTTDSSDTIQLYYGLDESERGVAPCSSAAQACSVLLQRYWRPAALVRLCRCARRRPCPAALAPDNTTVPLNNRAHFKFCEPFSPLPLCQNTYVGLSVETSQPDYSPDEFESLHHRSARASPPRVTAYCACAPPFYWRLHSTNASDGAHPAMRLYKCVALRACGPREFCGHVRADVESLYQRCACPARHACVHSGGLRLDAAEELMYSGPARKAYCEPILLNNDDDYDDYYDRD